MTTRTRSPRRKAGESSIAPIAPGAPFEVTSCHMREELDIRIKHPLTGQDTGWVWTIGHQFSKEARDARDAATLLLLTEAGEVEAKSAPVDRLLEQVIAVTKRWTGCVVNGVPLECTKENVRAILTDPRTMWARPQVQGPYLSLSRFFGDAKAS